MTNGFLRVAAVVPQVNVADVKANVEAILDMATTLYDKGVEIAVFPEMSLTGYTCGDLFHSKVIAAAVDRGLEAIHHWLQSHPRICLIVGVPKAIGDTLYNCGVVMTLNSIEYVAKTYIPNYNEFYERRWWASGTGVEELRQRTFRFADVTFGIEVCEDLWVPAPPSSTLAMQGAEVVFNLSASDDVIGKYDYLRKLITQQSGRCMCGYVYSSAGFGESSTDLVFSGKAMVAENGAMIAESDRWLRTPHYVIADIDVEALRRDRKHQTTFTDCRDANALTCHTPAYIDSYSIDLEEFNPHFDLAYRKINPRPFVPPTDDAIDQRCEEIINIQSAGLARRLSFIHCNQLVVGISGGLDSTLALLIAVHTFDSLKLDRKGITGVTMPGFGTTGRTYNNALEMMKALGITIREIPIAPAVNLHFSDIGHNPDRHDVTYENSQARERTQILMDVANQVNGIVLGTGDLSELALGWATYNGDHMSMYGVNAGVPKTLVKYLVQWFADRATDERQRTTLNDVIDTPISPELLPADSKGDIAQKTEDLVGPYELHDFFLYYTLRYGTSPRRLYFLARKAFAGEFSDAVILKWMRTFFRRFFAQQFKRSCLPDGPKVGSVCLSPRGDWRMPSDASAALWLAECDRL